MFQLPFCVNPTANIKTGLSIITCLNTAFTSLKLFKDFCLAVFEIIQNFAVYHQIRTHRTPDWVRRMYLARRGERHQCSCPSSSPCSNHYHSLPRATHSNKNGIMLHIKRRKWRYCVLNRTVHFCRKKTSKIKLTFGLFNIMKKLKVLIIFHDSTSNKIHQIEMRCINFHYVSFQKHNNELLLVMHYILEMNLGTDRK